MSGDFPLAVSGDVFFVCGIVLVIAALVLAFTGIRSHERFPQSRGIVVAGTAVFAAIVATTMAFAIVKSNQEQKSRNEKLAREEGATTTTAPAGPVTDLSVSSPADGGLSYAPNGLTAKPGNVAITYTNPSPVAHSIAVATANGNVVGQVQPFVNGKQTVTLNGLKPGKYVFYCTVPGHREAGMQGNLTVGG